MKSSKSVRILCAGLFGVFLAWPPAQAGSIFRKVRGGARSLTADHTARRVGDVVTIVINERSIVENESERKMDKTTSRTAKMGGTFDIANVLWSVGKHIFDFPALDLSTSSQTKFDGKADLDMDRSLIDEMTVTVQDVQPNGNLVVIGTRTRSVNGDTQVIQISGIVRPVDIDYTNKVKSTLVAEFHIVTKVTGQEHNFRNPGWLGRIANWLNPF